MWLKYKNKWSYSGTKWSWRYLGSLPEDYEDVQEVLAEISDKYAYSGIDYEVVEVPPSEVISEKIKEAQSWLTHYSEHLEYLVILFADAEAIERFEQQEDGPHSWKPDNESTK
ncbi:hypothetical protein LCGC14_0702100 [marine sediment metagenome]|uniref:Uncharacterized protein n=1 Tax=marine sediment metagenome TaxID=412755 RepID=A0A0F9TQA2_9ZZZZ